MRHWPAASRTEPWSGLRLMTHEELERLAADLLRVADAVSAHPMNDLRVLYQRLDEIFNLIHPRAGRPDWAQPAYEHWQKFKTCKGLVAVHRAPSSLSSGPSPPARRGVPRLRFQRPDDVHVFGYTADRRDIERAAALRENYPELTIETPLIAAGLTKAACLAIIERAGIKVPASYAMGFPNANCLPCVKATSPAYWALFRNQFPELFERMARLSRELDVRLCRLNGERAFIDEIPADHPVTDPIVPYCDFLCAMAEYAFNPESPE
jgi:hypothetical protein